MARVSKTCSGNKPIKNVIVIMKSKVYSLVKKELKMRISGSCYEVISQNVVRMVKQAAEQAKIERRMTIKPKDFDTVSRAEFAKNE